MGYATRQYASADAFLDDADSTVDCIISDQQMPGRTGLDLSEALQALDSSPPVILITALALDGLRNRARRSGVVALLEKPVQSEALTEALDSALAGHV